MGAIHILLSVLRNLEWIVLVLALIVLAAGYVFWRRFKPLFLANIDIVGPVLAVALGLSLVIIGHKAGTFVYNGLTAEKRIEAMQSQLNDAGNTIKTLDAQAQRKDMQQQTVTTTDAQASVVYRDKYQTIEKIVIQPDMTLVNKMAGDLTYNFYDNEQAGNAGNAQNSTGN